MVFREFLYETGWLFCVLQHLSDFGHAGPCRGIRKRRLSELHIITSAISRVAYTNTSHLHSSVSLPLPLLLFLFFPMCQVRVVRFYQSSSPHLLFVSLSLSLCLLSLSLCLFSSLLFFSLALFSSLLLVSLTTAPQLPAPDRNGLHLNCKCQIAVGTTGPQQQAEHLQQLEQPEPQLEHTNTKHNHNQHM